MARPCSAVEWHWLISTLIRMAGEQEAEPVIGSHEYRARYSWYRKLLATGTCRG